MTRLSRKTSSPPSTGSEDEERARIQARLAELEEAFLRDGFLHLRTEDLARMLRCSKRSLYEIAPSREALFEAIVGGWLARLRAAGHEAAAATDDPSKRITGYLAAGVEATRGASASFMRDMYRFEPTQRLLMAHQHERIEGLERLLDAGIGEGTFRGIHPAFVADVLLHAVARIVDPDVLGRLGLTSAEAFDELYDIVEHGLLSHRQDLPPRRRKSTALRRRSG